MRQLGDDNSPLYSSHLMKLALGVVRVETYSGCIVNGVRFLAESRDNKLTTQNSGVCVLGNLGDTESDFYGRLTSVHQVLYRDRLEVMLFKCYWFDTDPSKNGSIKRDYDLLSVNSSTRWFEDDPYILAIMAKPVFYLDDPKAGGDWKVAQMIKPRNIWDVPEKEDEDDGAYQEDSSSNLSNQLTTSHNPDIVIQQVEIADVPAIEIDAISIDLTHLPRIDPTNFIADDDDDLEEDDDLEDDTDDDDDDSDDGDDIDDSDDDYVA